MRIKPITIEPVLNGYMVQVGCQRLAFNSKTALVTELGRYLDNPDSVEKDYIKSAINTMDVPVATEPPRNALVATEAMPQVYQDCARR